jgi:FkbM family methyltransferase
VDPTKPKEAAVTTSTRTSFYSQNFEDVILARCFSNIEQGFYLDVGAQSEEADSVTRYFYDRGWNGINIEPVKEFADSFKRRDRDITICCAAGSEEKLMSMSVSLNSGLSSFSAVNAKNTQQLGLESEHRNIQVRTLDSILESLGIREMTFEFLKVDVEGFELDVIRGFNLRCYRPKVILCEVTEPNTMIKTADFIDICQAIESHDYQKVHFDGLNQWWCAAECGDELQKHFLLPPCIFDSTLITPYAGTLARRQIDGLSKELHEANQRLHSTTAELINAYSTIDSIYASRSWKAIRLLRKFMSSFKH